LTLTFLGTGTSQGVPVIGCDCAVCRSLDYRDKRLRSSVHIEAGGQSFVIDTGPDFRQQMLREHIKHVDAIIFTHAHRDHTAGLDDVRAYNFLQKADMPVYGCQAVLSQLKVEYAYAFQETRYPGIPQIALHEISDDPFTINGVTIVPLPVMHLNVPVHGFRIGNFCYITDANYIPDTTLERMKNTEVLVLNALQHEAHISHFNLEQAIEQVNRIRPEKAYFTHISHKLGRHALVNLPDGIELAFDGLKITCGS
jgi:phosphoribosyl 1,2-cyclic phosphate phosphodiesterase